MIKTQWTLCVFFSLPAVLTATGCIRLEITWINCTMKMGWPILWRSSWTVEHGGRKSNNTRSSGRVVVCLCGVSMNASQQLKDPYRKSENLIDALFIDKIQTHLTFNTFLSFLPHSLFKNFFLISSIHPLSSICSWLSKKSVCMNKIVDDRRHFKTLVLSTCRLTIISSFWSEMHVISLNWGCLKSYLQQVLLLRNLRQKIQLFLYG